MCGWPAGVGYPPIDGELEAAAAAAVAEPDPQPDEDAEHAAAQLDALAGMASRQSQPVSETSEVAEQETEPAAAPVEHVDHAELTASSDATDEDTVSSEVVEPDTSAVAEPTTGSDEQDVDPLTAPLETLPVPDSGPLPTLEPSSVESTTALQDIAPTKRRRSSAAPGRATSLARPAQLAIVAAAVLNLVMAGMQAAFGTPVDESMTTIVLGVALVTLGVWTVAAVMFLHWVSRAHTEVSEHSSYEQRHGSVMAVVGWLIPIVGFFVGYRVLQDLWTGSNPETRRDPEAGPSRARVIDVWLLGLITATVFAYALPLALGDSALWSGIAAAGVLVAGLALASIISTISGWQAETESASDETVAVADVPVASDEGTVSTRIDDVVAEPMPSDEPSPEPAVSATE